MYSKLELLETSWINIPLKHLSIFSFIQRKLISINISDSRNIHPLKLDAEF